MNNCHRIILALSKQERNKLLESGLHKSERRLLLFYMRTNTTLSISSIADKLHVHVIHVSRLNSSLYTKVFKLLDYHGTDKELDLLLKAGLHKYLFREISRRISIIPLIPDTSTRIQRFHSFFSYIFEVPYSKGVESFFIEVMKQMNSLVPDLPTGHKEAIELTALWINIGFRHIYTQKSDRRLTSYSKKILQRLNEYEARNELRENPFFLERLYNAFYVFHNVIDMNLTLSNEYIYKSYEANLRAEHYPYPFDPKSTLGVIRRRISYLFNLSMFSEYIDLFYSLSEEHKRDYYLSIVPRTFTTIVVSFVSLGRIDDARTVVEWYKQQIDSYENPSIEQQIILLHTQTIVQMHSEEYESALETIVEISKLNVHPNYNFGLEGVNRIFECECWILRKEWDTAYQTIRRTIKWYERNADSYMEQDIHVLKGLLDGLDFRETRSSRSKKRWESLLDSLREKKDLYGADQTINRISHLLGFPVELDIKPFVSTNGHDSFVSDMTQ